MNLYSQHSSASTYILDVNKMHVVPKMHLEHHVKSMKNMEKMMNTMEQKQWKPWKINEKHRKCDENLGKSMQAMEKLMKAMDKAMKRLEKSLKIMETLRKHSENKDEERTWEIFRLEKNAMLCMWCLSLALNNFFLMLPSSLISPSLGGSRKNISRSKKNYT